MSKEKRNEMKEELKKTKEELIRERYNTLAKDAKTYIEFYSITFKEWLKMYGLYSTGKDVNADVIELGNAILGANVIITSELEEELIAQSNESIKSYISSNSQTKTLNK